MLLKPVKDLNRLREMVYACLYPAMFNSRVEEEERFLRTGMQWLITHRCSGEIITGTTTAGSAGDFHCRINYRQLVPRTNPAWCLILRHFRKTIWHFIALMSHELDIMALAALLLRALFNGLLQEQLAHQNQRLPELGALLKQVNHLLRQANLPGQFPISWLLSQRTEKSHSGFCGSEWRR